MKIFTAENRFFSGGTVIALLLMWKLISLVVGAEILLPPPEIVLKELAILLGNGDFWISVLRTLGRGLMGFIISTGFGLFLAVLAGLSRRVEWVLQPVLVVVRSTPVMSIILLALIWFKTSMVPVFAAFLVAFPIIYGNVLQGMKSVDTRLLEMAEVFKIKQIEIVKGIRIPSLYSYFYAGLTTAMGITWKVIITAEVLSQPLYAVGTGLQEAKNYLETGKMFAWTMVAILISAAGEWLLREADKLIPWSVHHGD